MENRPNATPEQSASSFFGLTNTQFIVVAVLGIGVLLILCFIPLIVLSRIKAGELQTYYAAVTAEALAHPSATPTDTPPATNTPLPTATPTFVLARNRPRATVAPHTPVAGPLHDGWVKVSGSRSLRFEMDMGATGYVARLSGLPGYKEGESLMYIGADMTGSDNHMVMKGYIMTVLNMDPKKGLEVITVGDKSYVKGPQPMLGAFDDKWYYGPRSTIGSTFDSPDLYRGQDPDWAGFVKSGTETLDGLKCDLWAGGKEETYRFFNEFSNTGLEAEDSFDQLDRADTRIWLCPDGYLHQISMLIEGHPAGSANQRGGITFRMHFYDMDKSFKIAAPTNTAPLPPRSYWNVPTPMPTWTPAAF